MQCDKLLYTVPEVMERLQISRWMVYELIHRRELASVTIGRYRRVSARALNGTSPGSKRRPNGVAA